MFVLPHITMIKRRRISLEMTQKEFADFCGVSQSLIAKIENGRIDPSYSTVKKIFERLEVLQSNRSPELTAKEVMTKKVISVRPSDQIEKATELMLKHNISQIPVVDRDKIVGSITDKRLLEVRDDKSKRVEEVMSDHFPIVSDNTKFSTLSDILMNEPAVLVSNKNRLVGIVTKYDLIESRKMSR